MDDNIFGLLEKMYFEMQKGFKEVRGDIREIRGDITEIRGDITEIRGEIKEVKSELKQDIVRLENKMDNHFKALYDGYKQNTEKLCQVESIITDLNNKVELHEVEIKVIKGGK
ncbi:hypothetical protein [Alkaliphilus peptidifermentans]|uniref:Uncharacterized protein n=1 Tax=Alkaliphilus peptidifermentans DSM 18978 TaxID=1120976 RepID=A0A1G5AFK8_9FIRM|nr:hypothetical protein [Alkaliphilus peptidifermentans]SCX76670.1 hypothetical protein SAMN03080606_00108 [Alkaliphilus peptidifermentans DSM 18978]